MRWIPVLAMSAACSGMDASVEWAGTIETLPNGAVRVTNPAQGMWNGETAWRLVPALTLGSIEGDGPDVFASVSAIEADDAGRIYVLDRQANELRIFSPDGVHQRTVGRSGSGPGEYEAANGLAWIAPDSLLVIDQRGARFSVLTAEGEFVRSVQRQLGFFGWVANAAYVNDRIWETSSVSIGNGDERAPVLLGTSLADSPPARPTDAQQVETQERAVHAGARDTIMLPRSAAPAYQSFSHRNERGGMVMSVPFSATQIFHVARDGSIWHGHGAEFRIFRSTFDGDTVAEITVDAEPAPVTAEELAAWEGTRGVEEFREMGGRIDMERIPKSKPFFDAFLVAPAGEVWVSLPSNPQQVAFAVLDSVGRYLGRLQLDGIRRDAYIQPVIRAGRLHFVGRDELDVQRVYVFRIERT